MTSSSITGKIKCSPHPAKNEWDRCCRFNFDTYPICSDGNLRDDKTEEWHWQKEFLCQFLQSRGGRVGWTVRVTSSTLEVLSSSSCSVLKSITSSVRHWLIPSSWQARGQLNVTSAVMLQPLFTELPKYSYYSYRASWCTTASKRSWIKQIDCSFCPWFLRQWMNLLSCFETLECVNFPFLWWREVEPLGRTGKNSSSLALSNHFGWQSGREHSLLTGSDINTQGWIDSMQDTSLLGTEKLRHDFSFLCAPLWRREGCPATSFFPPPK